MPAAPGEGVSRAVSGSGHAAALDRPGPRGRPASRCLSRPADRLIYTVISFAFPGRIPRTDGRTGEAGHQMARAGSASHVGTRPAMKGQPVAASSAFGRTEHDLGDGRSELGGLAQRKRLLAVSENCLNSKASRTEGRCFDHSRCAARIPPGHRHREVLQRCPSVTARPARC